MTKRILIVENEPALLFALHDYLDHRGYEVDVASEVRQADQLLCGPAYDVVITDLLLSSAREPDGLRVIESAHQRDRTSRVVVLTACETVAVEESARRLRIDGFLRKPIPLSVVAGTVAALVGE